MKRTVLGVVLIAVVLTSWASGLGTFYDKFAYGGGVLGAGTGAIIGAASRNMIVGAAIGGPVGGIAGYLIGASLRRALESEVTKKSRGGPFDEADTRGEKVARR